MNNSFWLRRILALCACISFAHAQNWALWLNKIQILSDTDSFGDQIYFFILQKNNSEPVAYASMPEFPFSYTHENLPQFEPAILWQGDLKASNKVSLVLSLVDREALPWIADEVLGNIEVSIMPQAQGLEMNWVALTPSVHFDPNQTSPMEQRIYVEQNGGKYSFDLAWKMNENAS